MAGLSQEFKFRDVYNARVISKLAHDLKAAWAPFDADAFFADATDGLDELEMNARIALIAGALDRHLPSDFPQAARVLVSALPPEEVEPGKTDWDAFIVIPQCAFVSQRGLGHFDLSMDALNAMTRRLSAENHLRVFIELDFERAMATLQRWASDPNVHVRRLVSEGTRPRLPMTGRIQRFIDDPTPALKLLEALKADPSLYVRRSVANHLNDISKDNPEIALDTLERWNASDDPGTRWLVRHASRTLLKAGHPRAVDLFGYTSTPRLDLSLNILDDAVQIGGEVAFEVEITSRAQVSQRLLIDYVVDFVKANGKRAPKVFKWTTRVLAPGQTLRLTRRQHLRPTSGRKLYPGLHGLTLQINGEPVEPSASFLVSQ